MKNDENEILMKIGINVKKMLKHEFFHYLETDTVPLKLSQEVSQRVLGITIVIFTPYHRGACTYAIVFYVGILLPSPTNTP
jgi:hypothetical protein